MILFIFKVLFHFPHVTQRLFIFQHLSVIFLMIDVGFHSKSESVSSILNKSNEIIFYECINYQLNSNFRPTEVFHLNVHIDIPS